MKRHIFLNDIYIMSIIKSFIIVTFAVVKKGVITEVLNFALDQKIAEKLQNVETVKINTLTKIPLFK